MSRVRLCVLLLALSGGAQAAEIAASAQGDAEKALRAALKSFEGGGLAFELRSSAPGGPLYTLGPAGVPFNPDAGSRTLVRRTGQREVQVNPASPLPLSEVWRSEAARLLGLDEPILLAGARPVTAQDRTALRARYLSGGDLNNDGKIDLSDLGILASSYGKTGAGLRGDLNGDSKVDAVDVQLFQELYKFE